MMQQPNPMTATGIGAIARGMPQGMPQPKPQPAGIALSNVNQIANTQGTKTVPDGLKPLLALEEALSKVKAAQNQQALQQQIPQGTIQDQMTAQAEQTLQQARGQSPQQAAPQVAAASQQQEQQKQQAMQRLMSGVAQAPGAQQVRMAGGGIVAFQNRGEVPDPLDAARQRRRVAQENLYKFGARQRQENPEAFAAAQEELRSAERDINRLEMQISGGPAGVMRKSLRGPDIQGAYEDIASRSQDLLPQSNLQTPAPELPVPEATQAPQIQTAPMRMPPDQVASKVPVPRPSGAVPGQAAPGQPGGVAGLGEQVLKTTGQGISPAMGPQMPNIEAIRRARQEEASKVYGPSEEETKIYEEQMARMRQEAQPKDQRWYERLGALAPYLASQRIDPSRGGIAGGLGRIAMAGQQMGAAEQSEREKRQARIDALQKQRLDQLRSGRTAGFEAGIGAEKAAKETELAREGLAERRFATTEASRMAQAQIDAADRRAKEQSGATTDLQRRINLFKNDPDTYKSIFGKEEKNVAFEALKIKADLLGKQLTGTTPLMGDAKKRVEQELAMVEGALSKLAGLGGASTSTGPKVMTKADVDATAKSSGKSADEVIKAARAAGYTIQ